LSRPQRIPTYSAVNLWALVIAAALGGAAILTLALRPGPAFELAGAAALLSLLLLFTVRTSVTVERHGVRAHLGLFGFPRRFIGTDTIRRAVVVRVRPMHDFGGWGDRVGHASRAFVCRRGEALRLELRRGPAFIVTIEDAQRAADRVNAFVAERGRAPSPRPKKRRVVRTRPVKPWF
jgi:hypothetical protein